MGRLRFLLVALLAATMMFAAAGPAGAQTVPEFDDDFPAAGFEDDDLLEDFNPLEDFDPLEDDDTDDDTDDDDGDDD